MLYCCGRKMLGGWRKRGRQRIGVSGAWGLITGWAPGKPTLSMKPVAIRRDSVMSYEDVTQDLPKARRHLLPQEVMPYEDVTRDPYSALAYCQGVLEILQSHYLAWCKSALSEGDAALAAHYFDLVESGISLLAKTITDTLEKAVKGSLP